MIHLRGPQFDAAWVDGLAAGPKPETWTCAAVWGKTASGGDDDADIFTENHPEKPLIVMMTLTDTA
jgi:phage terminase large subunit-like protein